MISSLRGIVAHVGDDGLIIEVGGVGFSVATTPDVLRTAVVGESLRLDTMLIVREDALALFGFASREELAAFSLLLSVSGVGPKSALGVLSHLSVAQIADAVDADDDAVFRRVSGIGPKTAKLIVVQLTGKLAASAPTSASVTPTSAKAVAPQVVTALIGLGWSERVATDAVETAIEQNPSAAATVSALLRVTLSALGPARKAES